MKDLRAAACLLCLLGAVYCAPVMAQSAGSVTETAIEGAADPDSSPAAASHWREAEPVVRMAERERPVPVRFPDAFPGWMGFLVDAMLAVVALFSIHSLAGMRKTRGLVSEKETAGMGGHRGKHRGKAKPSRDAVPEKPPKTRARQPRTPRARAELLQTRRDEIAGEIDRLMKRI